VVADFFYELLLFGAELLAIVIAVVIIMMAIVTIMASGKNKKESYVKVEDLNEYYESVKDEIISNMLDKDEYKKHNKKQKKEEKLEKKEKKKDKKSSKCSKEEDDKPRLFVIRFEGDLHASEVEPLRESITAALTVANESDEILIILESCGGVVQNYGLGASQLQRIKSKGVNLTVAVDLVAASGGYMMACVANKILAAPFSVIGSVGVLAQIPNFHKILDKYDVDIEQHTAGEYKTTLTMLGENTNKAREKFKEELEDTHELFKTFVQNNRPALNVNKIATGEYWYGTQALDLNLIDEVITSDDYIMKNLDSKNIYEISHEYPETLKEKLASILEGGIYKAVKAIIQKTLSQESNTNKKMLL
jgi:serine protease SohB